VLFEGRHNELQGNLLLDHLFGARVEMRPAADRERADDVLAEVAAGYKRPCVIPFGGSNAVGAAAYAWGYGELRGQLGGEGRGTVVCVTSSGATHAGLAVGAAGLGGPRVVGVAIGDPAGEAAGRVRELAAEAASLLGVESSAEVTVVDGQQGEGYGVPTEAGVDAIRLVARSDGLLLDPVYTGKAMAGLIAEARAGRLEPPLVFLHSGGTPALFAYATELV
jgi:1-aminocyclopropane-1-carboxylate deaminase/D-cysteine desulfhydrase-like pyridoxal-dependent ACC family enzyme